MAKDPVFVKKHGIYDARLARQQEQGQQKCAALLDALYGDHS